MFCNAKAGTGKTLIATATANLLYQYGRCNGIVYIASPTQEQKQGYLKGTIEENPSRILSHFMKHWKNRGKSQYCILRWCSQREVSNRIYPVRYAHVSAWYQL